MTSIVNFFPVIVVALGALATLVMEPFLKDDNKHKIIPWFAAVFVALGMASFALVTTDTCHDLFAMDPVRRLLGLAVLLCTLLGVSGLQWTLGHEDHKGGEAYGLMLLASTGALLMTQAIDFVALFIAMELTSFPVYALVGIRRKDSNAGEGVFKYFVSGSIFSAIFLYGVALVYGATGTTHFSALILQGREPIYAIGILLTIFGLLFKAGAAPVHYWVADVYTGASVAVTGFMAAVVKVGALAALGSVWLGMLVTRAGVAGAWNLSEQVIRKKEMLHGLQQTAAYFHAMELPAHAKTRDLHCGKHLEASLAMRNLASLPASHAFTRQCIIAEVDCSRYDFLPFFMKYICLRKQFLAEKQGIISEVVIQVVIAAINVREVKLIIVEPSVYDLPN